MMQGFGFVGMLLFWGALLVLVLGGGALAIRQTSSVYSTNGQPQMTPKQILRIRLARGEIAQEQYEAILARIEG